MQYTPITVHGPSLSEGFDFSSRLLIPVYFDHNTAAAELPATACREFLLMAPNDRRAPEKGDRVFCAVFTGGPGDKVISHTAWYRSIKEAWAAAEPKLEKPEIPALSVRFAAGVLLGPETAQKE